MTARNPYRRRMFPFWVIHAAQFGLILAGGFLFLVFAPVMLGAMQ